MDFISSFVHSLYSDPEFYGEFFALVFCAHYFVVGCDYFLGIPVRLLHWVLRNFRR